MPKKYAGFTLIELLVVIGILGILLAIVLIAINPARQFAQANNTKRASETTTLLNAIHQYSADNHGNLPPNMPAKPSPSVSPTPIEIKWDGSTSPYPGNICKYLTPTYVSLLPVDPVLNIPAISDCTTGYNTGYFVEVDSNGRVTVSAPSTDTSVTQDNTVISVTR